MKKSVIVSLMAVSLFSLAGCDKPKPAANAAPAGLEPVLTARSFHPSGEDGLKAYDDRFTSSGYKTLANHCWEFPTVRKCMALYSKEGDGSHASLAEIGGFFAEYSYASKTWKVKADSTTFAVNGEWGVAPTPNFILLGPDRYGVAITDGSTHQGTYDEALFIYGISDKGFVETLVMPTKHHNGMQDMDESESYSVDVVLSQIIDPTKEVYDLRAKLMIEGKYDIDSDKDLLRLFGKKQEVILTYQNGQFVPAGKTTDKPAQ